ncbi:MAG TPA: bifunctional phosphoglucose/phosphomannose isomerase [Candidatus Eisenbacteria bacterium]|nr:bifunctional phosphoglucose/phosphomannose isomerase [Candidatus Eisenbacteria bacterium]
MSDRLEPAALRAHDPQGMEDLVRSWPAQIKDQRAALARSPWPRLAQSQPPRIIAVGALGGSATAAELVRGLVEDTLPAPFLIVREYAWPAALGQGSLCVLSSYSGNTEETLALYDDAARRGAARAVISSGGEIRRRAQADGVPYVSLPSGLPPRAALGYSLVSLLELLPSLGFGGLGEEALSEAEQVLAAGDRRLAPESPEAENPAKRLALALHGRVVVIYTAARFLAGAGLRWKGQVNENAKTPAFSNALPELNHNESVGWEALRSLHDRFGVVCLRDPEEHPRAAAQMEWTRGMLAEEGIVVTEARSSGTSRLARLLSLVQLGDWVSLYLAALAGVDPYPIVKIDALKRTLETTR